MIVELERTDLFFPHNTVIRSLDRACKDWRLGKGIDWWGGWGGKREGEDDGENFRSGRLFSPRQNSKLGPREVTCLGKQHTFPEICPSH